MSDKIGYSIGKGPLHSLTLLLFNCGVRFFKNFLPQFFVSSFSIVAAITRRWYREALFWITKNMDVTAIAYRFMHLKMMWTVNLLVQGHYQNLPLQTTSYASSRIPHSPYYFTGTFSPSSFSSKLVWNVSTHTPWI